MDDSVPSPAPRRVCVVGSGWAFTSGISYYTCRLSNALSATNSVSALLMRRLIPRRLYPGRDRVGAEGFEIAYDPAVRVFDGVDWFVLPSLLRAVRFLRREHPDVVLFQWWTGAVLHSYAVLAFVARRLGARVVVELHETQDTGEARLAGVARYVNRLGRRFLHRADAVIVHSEFDKAAVDATFGIAADRCTVLAHGPYDHYVADETPAEAQAPSTDTTILFFGTIRPYKGLEHLVEAFNALTTEQAAGLRLLVVGETWEGWTRPLDLIAASPHRERITVVNRYVRDDEVGGFFDAADAVVLPYTRSSASGPLHIAMAHGLPVVLSDVGGLREGAEGYEGITWVPPSDPDALRAALLTLPALKGARFTDARSWDDTVAVFDRLVAGLRG